jgi:hypothetical protein
MSVAEKIAAFIRENHGVGNIDYVVLMSKILRAIFIAAMLSISFPALA